MPFDFEKLQVYNKSLGFANEIYNITKKFPKDEQFGIINQLRRASLSASLNIAEGSGRSKKEFKYYITMSRTSIQECIPLLKLSHLQGFITKEELDLYYDKCEELAKMLSGLFNSF
jgi:four helix bundle protein